MGVLTLVGISSQGGVCDSVGTFGSIWVVTIVRLSDPSGIILVGLGVLVGVSKLLVESSSAEVVTAPRVSIPVGTFTPIGVSRLVGISGPVGVSTSGVTIGVTMISKLVGVSIWEELSSTVEVCVSNVSIAVSRLIGVIVVAVVVNVSKAAYLEVVMRISRLVSIFVSSVIVVECLITKGVVVGEADIPEPL